MKSCEEGASWTALHTVGTQPSKCKIKPRRLPGVRGLRAPLAVLGAGEFTQHRLCLVRNTPHCPPSPLPARPSRGRGPRWPLCNPPGDRARKSGFPSQPHTDLLCDLEPGTFVFYPGKGRRAEGRKLHPKETERLVNHSSGARTRKETANGKGWSSQARLHLFPACALPAWRCGCPPLGGLGTQRGRTRSKNVQFDFLNNWEGRSGDAWGRLPPDRLLKLLSDVMT